MDTGGLLGIGDLTKTFKKSEIERELLKSDNPVIFMEAAPGIEPGDYGFAIRCLTTWLCRHLNQHNLHPNIFDIIFSFQRQSIPL